MPFNAHEAGTIPGFSRSFDVIKVIRGYSSDSRFFKVIRDYSSDSRFSKVLRGHSRFFKAIRSFSVSIEVIQAYLRSFERERENGYGETGGSE